MMAVCLVPASIVGVGLLMYSYHQSKLQLIENSLTMARTISHLVDQHFSNVESTLQALSTSPSLSSGDTSAFYWQAKEALLTQKVANIVLTDANGLQLMNTLKPLGETLPENGSQIRVHDFRVGNTAIVSNLFKGKVAGRPVIAVAVPVRRSGQTLYGLSAGMSPDIFETMLRQQKLPSQWLSAVVDRNGVIVSRIGSPRSYVGQPATAELKHAMAESDEGRFDGMTPDGVPTYSVFKRSERTGWTVVIGVPTQYIDGQLRQALSSLFTVIGVVFLAGLLATRLLGNRIVAAISALVSPAAALGSGKVVTVPPLPLVEADQVGKALMRASEMLAQTRYQATHDSLTGLPNRVLFHEIIGQQVSLAERNKTSLSLLYIDLNRFKPVNDQYGHAAGDRLLVHVAMQLRRSLRESDFAARLGGDEFAVVLIGTGAANAVRVASKILEKLAVPLVLDTATVQAGASVGIASYPENGRGVQELLHAADEAMYQAKAAGENQIILSSLMKTEAEAAA